VAYEHEPVMRAAIVALFAQVPAGTIVDATLGGGGHTAALLEARGDLTVIGLDRDPVALDAARARLAPFGARAVLRHGRFDELAALVAEAEAHLGTEAAKTTGVLFDLGVSSPQLDRPERGFSYRHDAPLDMRMDPTQDRTAADVVNTYPEHELARIIAVYGDERFARRIASAIVARRPVDTTGRLAELVRDAIPAATRRRGGHPAKRTFQAIRIEVNDELTQLPDALDQAIELLEPGGRLAVLSYHSGEDRLVKQVMRAAETGGCTCPPHLPCVCGAVRLVKPVWRGGRTPDAAELARNPRASSARLRAVEKLTPQAAAPSIGRPS
jgi:16S rRNA (cytosine1402-N4)-methyltransferase